MAKNEKARIAEADARLLRGMQWARDNPTLDVYHEEIAEVREASGQTQAQAAEVIGCTEAEWAGYESGAVPMSMKTWKRWQGRSISWEIRMDLPDDDTEGGK